MMKFTIRQSALYLVVESDTGLRAGVSTRQVTRRVDTLKGTQHHRGIIGVVSYQGKTHVCGHRLHQRPRAAKACAVRLAKQIMKTSS